MDSPLVIVVVLHYHNWPLTEQCLASLKRLDYLNCQVLLVDNGSNERARRQVAQYFQGVEVLENRRNLGFAAGSNRGIFLALSRGAEYVWLLNNDTRVSPRVLTAMVAEAEADPRVGAVGSVLVNDDPGCTLQAWGGGRVNFFLGLPQHLRARRAAHLDYLCGASLLLRRQAIEEVGLFDEGYFLYWEDTDLSFRLRARGWKLAVAAAAEIAHRESGSIGFQTTLYDYHFTRSSIRFFRRHCRVWLWPAMISISGRITRRALVGAWENVIVVWKGFMDGMAMKISHDTP